MKIFSKDNNAGLFKGIMAVIILQVIFVLLLALIVYFIPLNKNIIKGINQFSKVFALFIAISLFITNAGFIKGGILGLISGIIIYFLFAFISGNEISFLSLLVDALFMMIIGAISGIIAVNIKRA